VTRLALILAFASALLVSPRRAAAGGWTQREGGFYGKLSGRLYLGDAAFGPQGQRVPTPSFVQGQLDLYLEVGVHERVTVVGRLTPWGRARIDGRHADYLGPMVAGARVGLITEGRLRLALQGTYGYAAPALGRDVLWEDTVTVDGEAIPTIYRPAIENHRVEAQVQVGRSFMIRQTPGWVTGDLGVRLNTGFLHALTGYAQVGVSPWRFRFDLHVSVYEPFFRTLTVANVPGVGDTRYLGMGLGVAFAITEHVGLTVDADGVFYAQSNAHSPSLNLGIEGRL
tara:strand:+ start:219 stop:1067 length:849 start_codon:yes stop_codon:yes gene_type:complete